jgi:hypothetical protein
MITSNRKRPSLVFPEKRLHLQEIKIHYPGPERAEASVGGRLARGGHTSAWIGDQLLLADHELSSKLDRGELFAGTAISRAPPDVIATVRAFASERTTWL